MKRLIWNAFSERPIVGTECLKNASHEILCATRLVTSYAHPLGPREVSHRHHLNRAYNQVKAHELQGGKGASVFITHSDT